MDCQRRTEFRVQSKAKKRGSNRKCPAIRLIARAQLSAELIPCFPQRGEPAIP